MRVLVTPAARQRYADTFRFVTDTEHRAHKGTGDGKRMWEMKPPHTAERTHSMSHDTETYIHLVHNNTRLCAEWCGACLYRSASHPPTICSSHPEAAITHRTIQQRPTAHRLIDFYMLPFMHAHPRLFHLCSTPRRRRHFPQGRPSFQHASVGRSHASEIHSMGFPGVREEGGGA